MKILCMDTSSPRLNVCVADGERLLYENISSPRSGSHAQYLPQTLEEVMQESGIRSLDEVDAIAVVVGPGSFTGLRIGLSVAKGLSFAKNISLIAIDGLDALAKSAPTTADYICPAIDAKKSQVYTTVYEVKGKKIVRLMDPISTFPLAIPFPEKGQVLCLGDGVLLYDMAFKETLKYRYLTVPDNQNHISPAILAQIAREKYQKGEFETAESLMAMYVRRSDAEIQRDAQKNK